MGTGIRRRVGAARRRARNLRGERRPALQPTASTRRRRNAPVPGMVEQFSKLLVVGWVSVPRSAPPVKLTLHLGPLRIASTYATPGAAMVGSLTNPHPDQQQGSGELVYKWQRPNIPGPKKDRRNSRQQIRTFAFRIRALWPYLRKSDRITVRVNGARLPIYGHGMFLRPPKNGTHTLDDLRAKVAEGYLLTQMGTLELSKKLDVEWQRNVMGLYQQLRDFLEVEFDHDLFFIGGTLLGAVREGGYIGHDVDFDAAYLSRHTSGPDVARELVDIALALRGKGFVVEALASHLHVFSPADPETRVDLFHVYFDEAGEFAFPWGVAGTSMVRAQDWRGTREIDFPGGTGLVPANAEQMVQHLYGDDWRLPKPGFNWHLDRTDHAPEGLLSEQQRALVNGDEDPSV